MVIRGFSKTRLAGLVLLCAAVCGAGWLAAVRARAGAAVVVSVNAASYVGPLAPGAMAAAFGGGLAARTEAAATLPLPTELAGTRVRIVDANGVSHSAPLFFVSPGQVNYLIPEAVALGAARVVVSNNGAEVAGELQVVNAAPALFTINYSGRGLPVALTTFDGINFEGVSYPDGSARAVSSGAPYRPSYLTLFGSGLRRAGNIKVTISGVEVTPSYAGAQGGFAGLDQINLAIPSNLSVPASGLVELTVSADGRASNTVQLLVQAPAAPSQSALSAADVQTILAQGAARAQAVGLRATIAVTDREGNVLGVFRMTGAPATTRIGSFDLLTRSRTKPADPDGLQDVDVPAALAAISKAGTGAFFSTQGSAISTRTAGFIIQEHFPPKIRNTPGGPLFGVQFSQLPCSDVKQPGLPLGLAGDPGGVPIYKNGVAAGGVGVEGDGLYSVDLDPSDDDQPLEEVIAVAATFGYEAPANLRIDTVQADGVTLPYVNARQTGGTAPALSSLPGAVDPMYPIRGSLTSAFTPLTLGGVPGRVVSPKFFPFKDSASTSATKLTATDVNRILTQAAQQAYRTRAAIRQPLGSPAEVNITVVDTTGAVLGIFSTQDAPIFGFDVSVQKARTAAFFSASNAAAQLRAAGFAKYADAALADTVRLDGAFAFTARAVGFLARPFYPDGIDGTANGPFSKPIGVWSPFNNGLQLELAKGAIAAALGGGSPASCTGVPGLTNGIQIFAGSVPLYKNGVLVGAIGISGDGIDQDDLIAATGATGYEASENIRADQLFPRGVRLPYVKFPRHPNL